MILLDLYVPETLVVVMVVTVGLVTGSYLNVVVYRLPAGISTVYPGSRCPRCLMPVKPWDNVPVLSYLWLGARCRACRTPISVRYPLVEAATAALFWASYWKLSDRPLAVAASCGLSALLVVLGLVDWDRRQVPVAWAAAGIVLACLAGPLFGRVDYLGSMLAAASGGLGILLAAKAWKLLHRREGFGAGDALVMATIGAFTGFRGAGATFVSASLAALLWLLMLRVSGRPAPSSVPFVFFLSAAALAVHFLLDSP